MEAKTPAMRERSRVAARFLTIALFIAVVAFLGITVDRFFTASNLLNVLMQSSALGFMAIGMTAVLVTGGIDLSIPAIMAFAGILGSMYMRAAAARWAAPSS